MTTFDNTNRGVLFAEGGIPTLDVGPLKRVSTSWLRQNLVLDEPAA